jgi:hypothetical protein
MLGIEAGAGEVAPKDWLVVFGGSVEGGWDDKLYVVDLSDPLQKQPVLWSVSCVLELQVAVHLFRVDVLVLSTDNTHEW